MSPPSARVQELVAANATFAESYHTPPTMKQIRENITDPVLVCMFDPSLLLT